MPIIAPSVKLNNGTEMPIVGLGTYKSTNEETVNVVKYAIECGYRHIDTAFLYENEHFVGQAIKEKIEDGTVKREEIFLVTKLWNTYHEPEKVEYACRLQLKNLGLDYIDLYLMHTPMGSEYVSDNILIPLNDEGNPRFNEVDYVDTWKAMQKLVELGLVKSIGMSNFNSEQVQRVLDNCTIKPVTNQVECGPSINQKELTKFCKDRDITLTAFCPLGRPHMKFSNIPKPALHDDKVATIGNKYGKTPAQVIIRYLIQLGAIPIPKSVNKKRIRQNLEVFDFELTQDEVNIMESFNTGERTAPFEISRKHKYFPLNIPF